MITEEVGSMLSSYSDSVKQMFKRTAKSQVAKYSKKLRAFSLTFNFYSPKAYNYARGAFGKALLHEKNAAKVVLSC